jgi:hypothetical protein
LRLEISDRAFFSSTSFIMPLSTCFCRRAISWSTSSADLKLTLPLLVLSSLSRDFSCSSYFLICSWMALREDLLPCWAWRMALSSVFSSCWRFAFGESLLLGRARSSLALQAFWSC